MKVGDRVKLTKVYSNHNFLRTNEIEGTISKAPELGSNFVMIAESLTPGMSFRYVETSLIESIEELKGNIIFRTRNSVYELERINDI